MGKTPVGQQDQYNENNFNIKYNKMSKVELVKQSDETAEDLELYQIHVPNQ